MYIAVRIGGVGILGDLDQFAKSVEEAANQKREEDEILTGVPDEFLDPIMSTVMMDPVILPSSKITIDRQTIARFLNYIQYFLLNLYVIKFYKYVFQAFAERSN